MSKRRVVEFFDTASAQRDAWKAKNWYYHRTLETFCASQVTPGASVLDIGCSTGDLLAAVRPGRGLGLDISAKTVEIAQHKYPHYEFLVGDAEALPLAEQFDYILMSDLLGYLEDAWAALQSLKAVSKATSRVIITAYNPLWRPVLATGERLQLKMPYGTENWLTPSNIENLLALADFEVEQQGSLLLLPYNIPPISAWLNSRIAKLRWARGLCLVHYMIARPAAEPAIARDLSCSVIVPCRNEVDNVRGAVERLPRMGHHTELIFVDGASTDGTVPAIESLIDEFRGQSDIKLIHQVSDPAPLASETAEGEMLGLGKGDAVRKGFSAARGDVLMILDADLTVPPEDLPKFFLPLAQGMAHFVNGTRLIYPMEDEAMKTANHLGNVFFSFVFTWLLGQRISDTLCGTKALRREDYERIAANRSYFGDFDPFGDFDLLFGAAHLGLRILEVPVRYRRRVAGLSKVRVIKHGWLLVRMSVIGFQKFKLNRWLRRDRAQHERRQ
jgi:SAM-dependent methyltransferase/glycosyltransferase involved in cell wall biosynthesis